MGRRVGRRRAVAAVAAVDIIAVQAVGIIAVQAVGYSRCTTLKTRRIITR
jgi:hypothetical protein